jgi:Putative secretion activating protein
MKTEEIKRFCHECIRDETNIEGGYSNDPIDLGGETNHGITVGLAHAYRKSLTDGFGWDGTMENLTQPMAYFIYESEFWHPMHLNEICQYSKALAKSMFRWGLKSGSDEPVTSLQETLNCLNNRGLLWKNIAVDGIYGLKTKGAIDALVEHRGLNDAMYVLAGQMNADQMHYMKHITLRRPKEKNERYYYGWTKRCLREVSEYYDTYLK